MIPQWLVTGSWNALSANAGVDHLALCVLLAIVPLAMPRLLGARWLVPFTCTAAIVVYRERLPGLVIVCVATYVFARAISRSGLDKSARAHRWRLAVIGMLVLTVLFLGGRSAGLDVMAVHFGQASLFVFVLNMWLALRLVSFLWEVGSGKVALPHPAQYFVWCGLPFLALGPLLRYSEFQSAMTARREPDENRVMFRNAGPRLLSVALAQISVAAVLAAIQSGWAQRPAHAVWQTVFVVFVTSPWSFYLLTSGTFKVMEATGLAWGIRLRPSFCNPFGQSNLSAFWAQWNVTATAVFRDYLFYTRWGLRTANVYINLIILFVLVGAWHGSNPYWLLWGLYHGLGFVAFTLWRKHKTRLPALPIPRRLARPLSWAMTYCFICAGWAVPSQILKILGTTLT